MAAALELMIIPVVVLVAIIVMGVWSNLSVGSVIFGAIFLGLLFTILTWILRYAWQVEEFEGVHEETGESSPGPRVHEAAQQATPAPSEAKPDLATSPPVPKPEPAKAPEPAKDIVEECGDESFPASDPPAWTLGPNSETPTVPEDQR